MAWLSLATAAIAGAAIIAVPGLLVALSLRLRGLWLVATTLPAGVGLMVLAAPIATLVGVRWSMFAPILLAVPLASVMWFAARRSEPAPRLAQSRAWVTPVAVALGSGAILVQMIVAFGSPDQFPQSFDTVFHLNAAQYILQTGDASPWNISTLLTGTSDSFFYPAAWHATTALVAQLTGATIPLAANAMTIVVGAFLWPAGAVLLTRSLVGRGNITQLASGILSAGFASYPLLLIPHMGTYPLFMSVGFVPVALASTLALSRLSDSEIRPAVASVILVLAMLAIGGAHPSAAVMTVVLALPIAIAALFVWQKQHPSRRRLSILLAVLASSCALALIVIIRPPNTQEGSVRGTAGQAVGELITGSVGGRREIAFAVATLTVIGMVALARRRTARNFAAIGVWITVAGIYIAAAGSDEFARLLFSGPWYADATRVAAFVPLATIPIASVGVNSVWDWLLGREWFTKVLSVRPRPTYIVGVVLLTIVIVWSSSMSAVILFSRYNFDPVADPITATAHLDEDDRELLRRLPDVVGADELVAGNPRNGSSLVYALTGRKVLLAHTLTPATGDAKTFLNEFSTSKPTGPGCNAAKSLGVKWVIDLHPSNVLPGAAAWPGVLGLDKSSNVELVERVGESSLYRVVGCGIG